jgi:SAM-dependent methyltransferase
MTLHKHREEMTKQHLVPPEQLRLGIGPFEDAALFLESGRETLELARTAMDLKPIHRILDVGCGCGRIALPAMEFLSASGGYCGLDVDADCIAWCQDNIQGRDGRFSFARLDIGSDSYNPLGKVAVETAVFPYPDGMFDRALVSSVFTHMTESGIARYLEELYRVLVPGGRILASLLLMNDATVSALTNRTTSFSFTHRLGQSSWTLDPDNPLDGVAVDEDWFRENAVAAGLTHEATTHGTWRDILGWEVQHDWMVLSRPDGEAS